MTLQRGMEKLGREGKEGKRMRRKEESGSQRMDGSLVEWLPDWEGTYFFLIHPSSLPRAERKENTSLKNPKKKKKKKKGPQDDREKRLSGEYPIQYVLMREKSA